MARHCGCLPGSCSQMAMDPGQRKVWLGRWVEGTAITECFMLSTPDFSISGMPRKTYSPLPASRAHHTLHKSVTSEGTRASGTRQDGLPFPSGTAHMISVNHEYAPWFVLKT